MGNRFTERKKQKLLLHLMIVFWQSDLSPGGPSVHLLAPKSVVPSKDLFKAERAFPIRTILVIGNLAGLFTVF
jgi:hypothetical protein